ncbi:cellulose binding domain-containing protein [Streptomyces castrisilvae]|uniref:Cellulose binding domain-containing protein n=1 Tax=Streptomyces castrisilvae TaxID=3033811 RepID=A0ABY9HWE0_9ACTN|nr:cellulose binding domain-containing protein [Streptomyces sp. Mut1]WLQ38352.1 cellulose binding domain-containing protein [Streptomyces sp. Mut1]
MPQPRQARGTGFTADVTVKNTGPTPLDGRQLGFDFQGGESVTNAWNATAAQAGTRVTVTGAAHNASVAAGGSVSFGLQANGAPAADPAAFTLNGKGCG